MRVVIQEDYWASGMQHICHSKQEKSPMKKNMWEKQSAFKYYGAFSLEIDRLYE